MAPLSRYRCHWKRKVGAYLELEMEGTAVVGCGAKPFALLPLRGTEDDSLHPLVPAWHLAGASQGCRASPGWQPQSLSSCFSN